MRGICSLWKSGKIQKEGRSMKHRKRGARSKFTEGQISACLRHLSNGLGYKATATQLGPDWTREHVRYYKRKHLSG